MQDGEPATFADEMRISKQRAGRGSKDARGTRLEMKRTRRSGSLFALISRLRFASLLQALFSRHGVFEEILVLRGEAFRKAEDLKAVAIADGPELDIG